jgi:hypothetical protein
MPAIEAWFEDGPVDGRVMAVETGPDGRLPEVVRLPQTGVFVGVADEPAPTVVHVYPKAEPVDDWPVYRYVSGGR